jgi:hypothetical protein
MRNVILVSLAAVLGFQANATGLNFNSGHYTKHEHYTAPDDMSKAGLGLSKQGSMIAIRDYDNNLTYTFDTSRSDEQTINPKLIAHLRANPGSRAIAGILDKLTIKDIQQTDGGMTGTVSLYFKMSSVFGTLSTKLQIGVQAVAKNCEISKYGGPATNFQDVKYTGSCVVGESGTSFAVTEMNSSLAPDLNNAVGLIADFVLRLMSPGLTGQIQLYEMR